MALVSGTKLGPYEIQSPLGAGGMGEVYRARDTRLDRTVAIKVLPTHLQSDPDLKARFDREARAISALQHAHICTLFDVGHQDGIDFLVMEFLEGETLASRLQKTQLPLSEILTIGIDIADALDKAHRQGIVHRDLKPGNIMLTKSGAKLMDFGLAKGRTGPQSMAISAVSGPLTPSTPTMNLASLTSPAAPLTQKGLIVGTFQYMAPETLQGAEADVRSDIFSFGCVLYEMTTGKRPFEGKSQVGVLAAILERDPEPVTTSAPLAPPALDKLIRTCLAKDPDQRWQSAHDLKLQLEAISEMGSKAGVPAAVVGARRDRKRVMLGLAVVGWLVAVSALVAVVVYTRALQQERHSTRAEINLPSDADLPIWNGAHIAISPDGKKLAIPGEASDASGLWIRDLESGNTILLPGTQGAIYPFWSPDSRMVGFFSNGKLRTMPAAGGPMQTICDAADGRGGSWSSTGYIVFTPNIEEPLFKVPEAGGTPTQITKLGGKGFSHRSPRFLPDGKHFLFLNRKVAGTVGELYAGSLDGGEPKLVLEKGSNAGYADGYLVYVRDGNLVAQRFEPGSQTVSGNPVPVSENVEYWGPKDLGDFSVSATGTLVYRTASSTQSRFAWMKLPGGGSEEFGDAITGINGLVRLSPDGRRIVFAKREPGSPNSDLWVLDIERNTLARQTFNNSGLLAAAFSPDATKIAFSSSTGATGLLKIKSLVNGAEQNLTPIAESSYVQSWTPDGRYLLIDNQDPKTLNDIYAKPVTDDKPMPLLTQPYNEFLGIASPNGKWMAYFSNESGRVELYVTDFPGAHAKWQISTDGAYWFQWSRDGRRLYFANGTNLLAVGVSNPDTMELGKTEVVTKLESLQPVGFAPDGRLLVLKPVKGGQAEPIHLVLHFTESLAR